MLTKFVLTFAVLALVATFAGNLPATAHVTLTQPAVVSGTALKAGDYRLLIGDAKVTFNLDKKSFDIPAKIETGSKKFDVNEVQYDTVGSQTTITEIDLGGTKTRLIFSFAPVGATK
jgi:hypothetical protein